MAYLVAAVSVVVFATGGSVILPSYNARSEIEVQLLRWCASLFTYRVKIVGCLAVATLELSHATVITSRGPAIAVKASQVLVELPKVVMGHCEGCGIAISVLCQTAGERKVRVFWIKWRLLLAESFC